jgi:hypothetical protein
LEYHEPFHESTHEPQGWAIRAQDKFLLAPLLPHKCGVPPGYGTPHLYGSEELCRALARFLTLAFIAAYPIVGHSVRMFNGRDFRGARGDIRTCRELKLPRSNWRCSVWRTR